MFCRDVLPGTPYYVWQRRTNTRLSDLKAKHAYVHCTAPKRNTAPPSRPDTKSNTENENPDPIYNERLLYGVDFVCGFRRLSVDRAGEYRTAEKKKGNGTWVQHIVVCLVWKTTTIAKTNDELHQCPF